MPKAFCGSFVGIVHDGERQAVFFDVLMDALNRVDGLGDAEDLEVFALIILGGFDDFRHFAYAAGAGGKPEVDEGDFAFQVGVGNGLPCRSGMGEIRGGLLLGIRTKARSAPIVATTRSVSIFFMM